MSKTFTFEERQAIVAASAKCLSPKPLTIAERLHEIAESPLAQMPSDNYGAGGFVTDLEQELAALFGFEKGVFMPSGTMAQPIALRIWCDRAESKQVAFHPLCHLQIHEQMGYRELHGLSAELLGETSRMFTLDDLKGMATKPAVVLFELPQREIGGQLPTWEDLVAMTIWCRENGIRVHLDGARLWECKPFYNREYAEIAGLFDSVYVSFYKILGGLPGAMLFGPSDFCQQSRIWLRRHGGNLHTNAPSAIAAKIGIEKHLPRMGEYVAHCREIASALQGINGVTVVPADPPTNMMHWHIRGDRDVLDNAVYEVAKDTGVLLFRWLGATNDPEISKVEVTISARNLDVTPFDISDAIHRLLAVVTASGS